MTDLVQYKFSIGSKILECTELPKDPDKDPCRIAVLSDATTSEFNLIRKDGKFQVAPEDASRVRKTYPNFQPPHKALKDYLRVTSTFWHTFGEPGAPTTLTSSIRVIGEQDVFSILDLMANFIAQGEINPESDTKKLLLERTILNSIAAFADPTMGRAAERNLTSLRQEKSLSKDSLKRIDWLTGVFEVRREFWDEMKPKMNQSQLLSNHLKSTSRDIMNFLLANHILADKGFKNALYTQNLKEAAQKHHDILSQIDSKYTVEDNFYSYMANVLSKVRSSVKLNPDMKAEFDRRIGIAIADFRKQADEESKRLLPEEKTIPAFKISLKLKYGITPERREALNLILPHINVKTEKGKPRYLVKMGTIKTRLQDWVNAKSGVEKAQALEAVRYVIDQLFERGEKMEAYWNGKTQQVESFFGSESFGKSILGGSNNLQLQELITWSHGESEKVGSPISPDSDPHEHFRKWTFTGELGVGALGLGTYFIPYGEPNANYYGHGASIILGSSGLGAAGGNALSYALDIKENKWLFDAGGAILGGLVGGLIYGLTTTKPDMTPPGQVPPPPDPGHRNPVDPYGP